MTNQKNVLLIGRTGESEEKLTNLLEGDIGDWKIIGSTEFDGEGPGDEDVAEKIGEACSKIRDGGLAQILFMFGGRINKQEAKVYSAIMNKIFSDEKIRKITTIVRTNFPGFESEKERKKDLKALKLGKLRAVKKAVKNAANSSNQEGTEPSKNVADLIKLIDENKIVYIYIPKNSGEKKLELAKPAADLRKESRKVLLDHLNKNCKNSSYENNKSYYLESVKRIMVWSDEIEEIIINKRGEGIKTESVEVKVKVEKINDKTKVEEKETEIKEASLQTVIEISDTYKKS